MRKPHGVPDDEQKQRRFRIDLSDLVLEIVSIAIAIVVATAVGEWREGLRERADVQRALTEIRTEVDGNLQRLRAVIPLHRTIYRGFSRMIAAHAKTEMMTADDFGATFTKVAPSGMRPFLGFDNAWQVARVTGTAAHLDYGLLTRLEETYAVQDALNGYRDRLIGDLHLTTTADKPNFFFVAQDFQIDFADLTYAENELERDYTATLAAIDDTRSR